MVQVNNAYPKLEYKQLRIKNLSTNKNSIPFFSATNPLRSIVWLCCISVNFISFKDIKHLMKPLWSITDINSSKHFSLHQFPVVHYFLSPESLTSRSKARPVGK